MIARGYSKISSSKKQRNPSDGFSFISTLSKVINLSLTLSLIDLSNDNNKISLSSNLINELVYLWNAIASEDIYKAL